MDDSSLVSRLQHIYQAARESDDGRRCMVAPHPALQIRLQEELKAIAADRGDVLRSMIRMVDPQRTGFNDGTIIPPNEFPLGTAPSRIRAEAAVRAPLRGAVRVVVVLVDFSDRPFDAIHTRQHFEQLFFSQGVLATKSVREYFSDVTHGLVDIQGEVVGPFRMPRTLAAYAHGESGTGMSRPNAQTMARDAVVAADSSVGFAQYDNDGNGYVDAFIVVHAGPAAEVTGSPDHIWSHKWVLDGGAISVDGTKIYAYLTVPEDAKIGVCCHELGHLLFGFPDLYDTDYSSQGIGDWCLMAGGSWGGGGDVPCHPSAWCKANQGWVNVENITLNKQVQVADVKNSQTIYRLWRNGAAGTEYFLMENRQRSGFDSSLPGDGLLVWHIDDAVATNSDASHYKVALVQADGRRDLEKPVSTTNQGGDPGDPFPGSSGKRSLTNTTQPNSQAYGGQASGVSLTQISDSGSNMNVRVRVRPGLFSPTPSSSNEMLHLAARVEAIENKIEQMIVDSSVNGAGQRRAAQLNGDVDDNDEDYLEADSSVSLARESLRAGLRHQG